MTDVTAKLLSDHLDFMLFKGVPTAPFLRQLHRLQPRRNELESLKNAGGRVSWAFYAEFLRLWEEECGGGVCALEFVEWSLTKNARWQRIYGPVTRAFLSPARIYELSNRWAGPMLFSNVKATAVRLPDGRLEISLALRPEDADCAVWFRIASHVLRRLPSSFGYPDALVEAVLDGRSGRYLITPPMPMSFAARCRRRLKSMFMLESMLDEFAQRDLQVRDGQTKLLVAQASLETEIQVRTADLAKTNLDLVERIRVLNQVETLAHLGSWSWDLASGACTLSDEMYRIFGMRPGDAVPSPAMFLEKVHPDDRTIVEARLIVAQRDGELASVHRIVRPDGSIRFVQTHGEIAREGAGLPRRMIGTVHDITVQRDHELSLVAARDEADRANRAKTTFLASMSHEIRTPMTSVLGFADLLTADDLLPPMRNSYVEKILRNGRHLLALIDDILDMSQIEAGHLLVRCAQFSPETEIGTAVDVLRSEADKKGLQIAVAWDSPMPAVMVSDQVRFRQILLNLLGNAIKYTDEGGVKITARRLAHPAGDQLEVVILDTGMGIDVEHQEALFQPFFQANFRTSRPRGGSGLGLALAQTLARALGGDVELVASARGQGSTFRACVSIELQAPEEIASAAQATLPESQLAGAFGLGQVAPHLRVLVAEDNTDIQEIVKLILENAGAHVTVVGNGSEALSRAATMPFDLVVMDMQMPVLDGFEATKRLRASGFTKPIVAMTALAMRTDRERYLAAGCDDFLAKPVEALTLIQTVVKWTTPRPEGAGTLGS